VPSNRLPGFATQLNALFSASTNPATGKRYTNLFVAEALMQRWGVAVTPGYLSQLRNGHKEDPAASLVGALAQFFDVPVDYFFGFMIRFEHGELARRLELLERRAGSSFDGDALVAHVASSVETFDESAWRELHEPEQPLYVHESVLRAIADYFDARPEYLIDAELDDQLKEYEAHLDLTAALVESGATGSSMRNLGKLSPDALRAIAASLRDTLNAPDESDT